MSRNPTNKTDRECTTEQISGLMSTFTKRSMTNTKRMQFYKQTMKQSTTIKNDISNFNSIFDQFLNILY